MLNTLLELHKQGVEIYMTDEGWKVFLQYMSDDQDNKVEPDTLTDSFEEAL